MMTSNAFEGLELAPAASVDDLASVHFPPHADHERLDAALVCATDDAEVTVLAPIWAPGVSTDLGQNGMKEDFVT